MRLNEFVKRLNDMGARDDYTIRVYNDFPGIDEWIDESVDVDVKIKTVIMDVGKQRVWLPKCTAPKDGRMIIGQFDCDPYICACLWHEPCADWVCAKPMSELYEGRDTDTYFENDHTDDSRMVGWMEFLL